MRRGGRFRLVGPDGRCVVCYRLGPGTVFVRVGTVPRRVSVTFRLRALAPAIIRHVTTFHDEAGSSRDSSSSIWDLRAEGRGFASIGAIFDEVLEAIGLGDDAPPSRARTRGRIRTGALLSALGREAVRRCDPRARALATSFPEGERFWVYQQIVGDTTGRVGQMASVCPGLLLVARGLSSPELDASGAARALLDGIVAGRPLARLLAEAAELSLAPEVLGLWSCSAAAGRHGYATGGERARVLAARRLLIRRARALVRVHDLLEVPPPRFAPEDVSSHPVENARWFETMRRAQHVLGGVCEVDLREGLSSFVSRNALLLAARARRRSLHHGAANEHGPGVIPLLELLLRFVRATGRRPGRGTNARRLLAECERWARERGEGEPAGRLGDLLRRVPALGLGEVIAVRELGADAFSNLERVELPRSPAPEASAPGLEARAIETPEALAEEGARMNHCVASWLPRLMAGDTWVYSVRAGGRPMTVALERAREAGVYRVVDARLPDDAPPTAYQRSLLDVWIRRLNDHARRRDE